jgi:hypothetical protein
MEAITDGMKSLSIKKILKKKWKKLIIINKYF